MRFPELFQKLTEKYDVNTFNADLSQSNTLLLKALPRDDSKSLFLKISANTEDTFEDLKRETPSIIERHNLREVTKQYFDTILNGNHNDIRLFLDNDTNLLRIVQEDLADIFITILFSEMGRVIEKQRLNVEQCKKIFVSHVMYFVYVSHYVWEIIGFHDKSNSLQSPETQEYVNVMRGVLNTDLFITELRSLDESVFVNTDSEGDIIVGNGSKFPFTVQMKKDIVQNFNNWKNNLSSEIINGDYENKPPYPGNKFQYVVNYSNQMIHYLIRIFKFEYDIRMRWSRLGTMEEIYIYDYIESALGVEDSNFVRHVGDYDVSYDEVIRLLNLSNNDNETNIDKLISVVCGSSSYCKENIDVTKMKFNILVTYNFEESTTLSNYMNALVRDRVLFSGERVSNALHRRLNCHDEYVQPYEFIYQKTEFENGDYMSLESQNTLLDFNRVSHEITSISLQVLYALYQLHSLKISHNDLHFGNIMIREGNYREKTFEFEDVNGQTVSIKNRDNLWIKIFDFDNSAMGKNYNGNNWNGSMFVNNICKDKAYAFSPARDIIYFLKEMITYLFYQEIYVDFVLRKLSIEKTRVIAGTLFWRLVSDYQSWSVIRKEKLVNAVRMVVVSNRDLEIESRIKLMDIKIDDNKFHDRLYDAIVILCKDMCTSFYAAPCMPKQSMELFKAIVMIDDRRVDFVKLVNVFYTYPEEITRNRTELINNMRRQQRNGKITTFSTRRNR